MKKQNFFEGNFTNENDLKYLINQLLEMLKNGAFKRGLFYRLIIEERKRKRTLPQNDLYRIFLKYLEIKTGQWIDDEWHYLFRANFLPLNEGLKYLLKDEVLHILYNNIKQFNYVYELPFIIDMIAESTTKLNTIEFSDYLKKIAKFSAETLDIELVFPDDNRFKDFRNEYNKLKNKSKT